MASPAYADAPTRDSKSAAAISSIHPEDREADIARQQEEDDITDTFRRRLNEANEHSREWRQEARELYDMRAGDQWTPEDEARLREQLRPMVTFNVADKYIDAVNGLQINNRQEIRFYPRRVGEASPDELFTGAAKYCRDETDAEDEETESFVDLTLVGMAWQEGFLDTDRDAEGVCAKERRDPLSMRWDPYATRRNLSDMKWCARIILMDPDDFESKFPEASITGLNDSDLALPITEFDTTDTAITIIENPQDYISDKSGWGTGSRCKIAVADYQYWEYEFTYTIQTPRNKAEDLTEAEARKLRERLKSARILYAETRHRKRCYYRCYFAGNKLLRRTKLAYQKGFTYFCLTGKRDRNTNTWYGVGRGLRDPQMWLNKFFSQILHVINTNAKGGVMAEENAFTDRQKAENDWARADAIIDVAPGALSGGKIVERKQSNYPEGMDRLMQFSMSMLPQVSGLNPEMLGLADRDQPGVLEAQRKQAALAIIAWCFDAMRLHYKQAGRWYADYIRQFMADGRLVRIVGKTQQQYLPLVRDQLAVEYDVIVDDAPTSVNMKERVFAAVQAILPIVAKMGIPMPEEIIDYLPVPQDLAQAWKKKLQPSQAQQMAQQLEGQQKQADIADTQSAAKLKQAQAQKALADAGAAGQQPGAPQLDPNTIVTNQHEERMAKLQGDIEARLANMQAASDRSLQLLLAQMNNTSKENIASLQAAITLSTAGMKAQTASDATASKERMAERDAADIEERSLRAENDDKVLKELASISTAMKKISGPRKMVYDDKGDLVGVE